MKHGQLLEQYYENGARRLHRMIDGILVKFGGLYQKDYDDFYSLGNEVFVEAMKNYDSQKDFEGFLYTCLSRKIKTEITRRNRIKRSCDRMTLSLEAPIGEDSDLMLKDILVSDFNVEQMVLNTCLSATDEHIEAYLAELTALQRQILRKKMNGIPVAEIKKQLGLSEVEYENQARVIRSFDKTSRLFRGTKNILKREWREENMNTPITAEISKETSYSVSSCIKRMDSGGILTDHPLQRNSDQWSSEQKGNLVATILNGFPIPPVVIAEQVRPGGVDNYLLDGLQRFSNLHQYKNNAFKVSKKAERADIPYQVACEDDNGTKKRDRNGRIVYEERRFNIQNQYYRDLPCALQERFDDYTIHVVQYLNCSDHDIEYHIRRYNAAKPMSPAQKGITHLGEQYARMVKMMIRKHEFFKEIGGYKLSEFRNGTMDRVVVEGVMAAYFINDWRKRQEDMCEYLKEHAKADHFESFESMLDRLTTVMTPAVAGMFDSKDSFLWFGLFSRFLKCGVPDHRFVDFMKEFSQTLYQKKWKGISFADLNEKSTKDKSIVIQKLALMEKLMKDFV